MQINKAGFFMKTRDMIETLLKGSTTLGTFAGPEIFRFAKTGNVNGIAVAKDEEGELYLAIIDGETEGAIFIDEKGELFGDNAARKNTGRETFTLYDVKKDLVDAVAMGCRVFEKSHMRSSTNYDLPQFGTKSSGIGNLTLVIRMGNEPQNGIRVSIRKEGKIVGSDVTTNDGSVGFRVMHGNYDCIVQDRNQMITTVHIKFNETNPKIILDL
jgi:hypothetical protein